ncbi:hypothetical protein D9758_002507 [Tetrapyrgos nigripes]|uniref:Uncharacterized protein n=1 Tax=Tetrapyrgos nigripes TaxID=182062 RepID=A0A8H5GQT0_9AGAR|nr:hypothetical protein D9758_002507 [Tetrapyrgos nigripes]
MARLRVSRNDCLISSLPQAFSMTAYQSVNVENFTGIHLGIVPPADRHSHCALDCTPSPWIYQEICGSFLPASQLSRTSTPAFYQIAIANGFDCDELRYEKKHSRRSSPELMVIDHCYSLEVMEIRLFRFLAAKLATSINALLLSSSVFRPSVLVISVKYCQSFPLSFLTITVMPSFNKSALFSFALVVCTLALPVPFDLGSNVGQVESLVGTLPAVGSVTGIVDGLPVVGDLTKSLPVGTDLSSVMKTSSSVTGALPKLPVRGLGLPLVGDLPILGDLPVVGDVGSTLSSVTGALPVDNILSSSTGTLPVSLPKLPIRGLPIIGDLSIVGNLPVVGELVGDLNLDKTLSSVTGALPLQGLTGAL